MNELDISDEYEETTVEVTVSMMSMMRVKWKQEITPSAMELDEEIMDDLRGPEVEKSESSSENEEESEKEEEVKVKPSLATFVATYASKAPKNPEKSTKYRRYTAEQIMDFIILTDELVPVTEAAKDTGITLKSAYRFRKQWREFGTVERKKRGRPSGTVSYLKEEHIVFLVDIVDENPTITIIEMWERLNKAFPSLFSSKSALYRHLKNCVLSMKKLEIITTARNSPETIQKRMRHTSA